MAIFRIFFYVVGGWGEPLSAMPDLRVEDQQELSLKGGGGHQVSSLTGGGWA